MVSTDRSFGSGRWLRGGMGWKETLERLPIRNPFHTSGGGGSHPSKDVEKETQSTSFTRKVSGSSTHPVGNATGFVSSAHHLRFRIGTIEGSDSYVVSVFWWSKPVPSGQEAPRTCRTTIRIDEEGVPYSIPDHDLFPTSRRFRSKPLREMEDGRVDSIFLVEQAKAMDGHLSYSSTPKASPFFGSHSLDWILL